MQLRRPGELWLGMMAGSLKAADVLRDARVAIHSGYSDTTPEWHGGREARGRVREASPAPRSTTSFRLDIREASVVRVNDEQTHLIIDVWTADGGLKQIKRKCGERLRRTVAAATHVRSPDVSEVTVGSSTTPTSDTTCFDRSCAAGWRPAAHCTRSTTSATSRRVAAGAVTGVDHARELRWPPLRPRRSPSRTCSRNCSTTASWPAPGCDLDASSPRRTPADVGEQLQRPDRLHVDHPQLGAALGAEDA